MRQPDLNVLLAAVLFAIFTVMVVTATTYTYEARLVPLVIGIPAMTLAAWQLLREIRFRKDATRFEPSDDRRLVSDAPDGEPSRRSAREVRAISWLFGFTIMVLVGGFLVGGTLAVIASQRFWLRESWRTALIGGAIAALALYLGFERGLGLPLYSGWIAEWIG
jgi:ABC-type sugar transport system permease subunit